MRCIPPPTQIKAHLVAGDVEGKLVSQLAPRMQGVHQGGGGGAALGGWRRRMGLRQLLRARLGSMCPNGTAALDALWRWRSLPKEHPPFLLQVASYDRQGMLHSLTHVLWESDATVRQGGGGEGWRAGGEGVREWRRGTGKSLSRMGTGNTSDDCQEAPSPVL